LKPLRSLQAYYRRALKYHPDKVAEGNDREAATKRFQELGYVYRVLSDPRLRQIYDQTGSIEPEDEAARSFSDDDRDWAAYWRELFPPVTAKEIAAFEKKYKGSLLCPTSSCCECLWESLIDLAAQSSRLLGAVGSAEELEDLKTAYKAAKGSMDVILDNVYFGHVDEELRYRQLLEPLVASGELPAYAAFTKESAQKKAARRKRAERERAEAEAHAAVLNLKTDSDLAAVIQKRREAGHADLIARLEAKYGGGGNNSGSGRKRTKASNPEPSEEEFAAVQERLLNVKKGK